MKILLLFLSLIIFGCEKENPVDPNEELTGVYKSTSFIEPGAQDGGLDIQAAGGYLLIDFDPDSNYTAERYIPTTLDSDYPKGKILFEGTYFLRNDSIMFNLGEFFIDHLTRNTEQNELKYELNGRGYYLIILHKQ